MLNISNSIYFDYKRFSKEMETLNDKLIFHAFFFNVKNDSPAVSII